MVSVLLTCLAVMGESTHLPLSREVTESGGDTEEDTVVLLELLGVLEGGDAGVLGRSVHLGQDLLGESLGDLVDIDLDAGLLSTLLLGLGEGLDMPVKGVL
jgi:hypothetical protein